MSTEMLRRNIRPDELRETIVDPHYPLGTLAQYLDVPSNDPLYPTAAVLRGVHLALGERVAEVFFSVNPAVCMHYAAAIVRDHCMYENNLPKDLQTNLVANLTIRLVRDRKPPRAQRYGYGECLIRQCKFAPEFKLALKVLMFDNHGIDTPWVLTMAYPERTVRKPGVWSV